MSQHKRDQDQSKNKLPESQAHDIKALVDVQKDAIVSRVLGRTTGGSLTLFAFDQGQELSEHSAPFDAIVQIVDGSIDLVIGGKKVHLGEGQIALMPADIPHAVKAPEPVKMLLTMLKG